VDIDFNPAKDTINRSKHGLSLALARQLDWLTGRVQPGRTVGGESRWKIVAECDGVVYAAIFTRRADVLWIISVRRASRKERRDYGEA
jgi:uncharacterized DUF497 family protein